MSTRESWSSSWQRSGDVRTPALNTLTAREQQILALVAEGWSNAAISDRLVITKRAVERHIHSIFWKLSLDDSEHVSRRVQGDSAVPR